MRPSNGSRGGQQLARQQLARWATARANVTRRARAVSVCAGHVPLRLRSPLPSPCTRSRTRASDSGVQVPDRRLLFQGVHFRHANGDRLGHGVVHEAHEGKVVLGTERDDEAIEGREGWVRVGVVEQGAQLGAVHPGDLGERGNGGDVLPDDDLLEALDDSTGSLVVTPKRRAPAW